MDKDYLNRQELKNPESAARLTGICSKCFMLVLL